MSAEAGGGGGGGGRERGEREGEREGGRARARESESMGNESRLGPISVKTVMAATRLCPAPIRPFFLSRCLS